MKKYYRIVIFVILLSLFSSTASAATIMSGEKVEIEEGVNDDLYAVGGTVEIERAVLEDAIVAGGKVYLKGVIEQDLIIAGGQVFIREDVRGDMIILGGEIEVEGDISDDVVILAGKVSFRDTSVIGGDLLVAGGQLELEGTVRGEVRAYAGEVDFTGTIEDKAEIRVGSLNYNGTIQGNAKLSAREKIKVGENAAINGNLNYWKNKKDDDMFQDKVLGEIKYDSDLKVQDVYIPQGYLFFSGAAAILIHLLNIILMTILFVWLGRKVFHRASQYISTNPLRSFGIGALYFIAVPILSIILIITLFGIPLGVFLLLLYFFTFIFLQPMIAVVAARLINMRFKMKWSEKMMIIIAVGIAVALQLLSYVFILNILVGLVTFVAALATIGALVAVLFSKIKNENKK